MRGPHLSIVALVDEPAHLDAVIQSVVLQSFEDWDLSLIPLKWRPEYEAVLEGPAENPRIRLVSLHEITRRWHMAASRHQRNGRLSRCAKPACPWRTRADRADDTPSTRHLIYTDDDLLDSAGQRSDPNLKGAFSPELALVDDYATRLAVSPRRAIVEAGGLRPA